jgi:hypothetical protein
METIKCGQALPSRRVAAAIRDESSAARTADGDVGFVRPLHSLHVRLSLLLRPHAVVLVSRFASRVGLVTLRQTFVCRSHGGGRRSCQGLKHEQSELFSPEC